MQPAVRVFHRDTQMHMYKHIALQLFVCTTVQYITMYIQLALQLFVCTNVEHSLCCLYKVVHNDS